MNKNCIHGELAARLLMGLETINEILNPEKTMPDAERLTRVRTALTVTLIGTVDLAVEMVAKDIEDAMLETLSTPEGGIH